MDGNVVLLLLFVAIVVFLLYTRNRPPKTPAAVELTRRLGTVRYMSGAQFEGFVAEIMRGLGYRATVLGGSGDQGVDVIATAGKERIAIQCKNYAKPVGNKPVQEVYAGAQHHRCTAAWVVAPEGFTKGAVELARSVGVSLRDAQALRGWIRQIDAKERARGEGKPANQTRRTVDLDAGSIGRKGDTTMESGMEKHTISVGAGEYGETVAFTANKLGTASVNGGSEGGGLDFTVYRLPDGTYRVLSEQGDVRLLEPSNFLDVFGTDKPAEYGRWTYEEADGTYGDMFKKFMAKHPAGRKRVVRDLD